MTDPHLNLFYSYNLSSKLIENNLTRAWVMTLRLLSAPHRDQPLHLLFDPELPPPWPAISFGECAFALQDQMDPSTRSSTTPTSRKPSRPGS